jgi:ferric-dicitrate binding protein FerR (iron transport regulator)
LDNLSNQEASLVESTSIIKSNPKGQKSMIMLPDGSRIWLNAESTIKYEENFSDSLRVVQLTGEAFFDVVKDPLRPFIVEANDLKTTVIGTSFNVYSYPESQGATVSLLSGKLKLTSTKENTFLEPGEQANHNQENGTLTKQKIDIETIALWKDNILVFEKEEFETVIHRLERWYGVDIVIQGQPAKQWKFTGYFENENLKNVLEVLSFGKNINFKIEGKHVRLMMN